MQKLWPKDIMYVGGGMNIQNAFRALTRENIHWDRIDKAHIVVWTSGYNTVDAQAIEKYLMQFKVYLVGQEFDKVCGKTRTVYYHKEIL